MLSCSLGINSRRSKNFSHVRSANNRRHVMGLENGIPREGSRIRTRLHIEFPANREFHREFRGVGRLCRHSCGRLPTDHRGFLSKFPRQGTGKIPPANRDCYFESTDPENPDLTADCLTDLIPSETAGCPTLIGNRRVLPYRSVELKTGRPDNRAPFDRLACEQFGKILA